VDELMGEAAVKDQATTPAPEEPRRIERAFGSGLHRCPYCHEGCPAAEAVVCRDCLGRHHDACWVELAACSACGAIERLVPERADASRRTDAELFLLLRAGRYEVVEDYLRRCAEYTAQTRSRTDDEATRLAFERVGDELAKVRRLRVVGLVPPRPTRLRRALDWLHAARATLTRPLTAPEP
jgi:hypothetical protein